MSKTFSQSDVASHNKADNLWIIVDDDVYDLTKFQEEHPGNVVAFSSTTHFTDVLQVAKRVSFA